MRRHDWAFALGRDTCEHLRTREHMSVGHEGSKGINIKTGGLLERNRSAMYIMYQDRYGLPKKIPYRQATEE